MDTEELTEKVEYEDNSIPIENKTIVDINNGYTEEQEYDDEVSIEKTDIDNIVE